MSIDYSDVPGFPHPGGRVYTPEDQAPLLPRPVREDRRADIRVAVSKYSSKHLQRRADWLRAWRRKRAGK